jgi:hypothetical protein
MLFYWLMMRYSITKVKQRWVESVLGWLIPFFNASTF